MATIYAVSAGSYSDYHVEAVFSTREKAEAYAAWRNGPELNALVYDKASIEEWALDKEIPQNVGTFIASYCAPGGFGRSPYDFSIHWCPDSPRAESKVHYDHEWDAASGKTYPATLSINGYGKSSEHARRAVLEKVRAIKAGTLIVPDAPREMLETLPIPGA